VDDVGDDVTVEPEVVFVDVTAGVDLPVVVWSPEVVVTSCSGDEVAATDVLYSDAVREVTYELV